MRVRISRPVSKSFNAGGRISAICLAACRTYVEFARRRRPTAVGGNVNMSQIHCRVLRNSGRAHGGGREYDTIPLCKRTSRRRLHPARMVSIGQAIFASRTTNGGYDELYRTRTPDQARSSRGTQYRSGNSDLCDRYRRDPGGRADSCRTLAGLELVLVSVGPSNADLNGKGTPNESSRHFSERRVLAQGCGSTRHGTPALAGVGRHDGQPTASIPRPSYPTPTGGALTDVRGTAEQAHLPAAQHCDRDRQGAHRRHPEGARCLQQAAGCGGGATLRHAR